MSLAGEAEAGGLGLLASQLSLIREFQASERPRQQTLMNDPRATVVYACTYVNVCLSTQVQLHTLIRTKTCFLKREGSNNICYTPDGFGNMEEI